MLQTLIPVFIIILGGIGWLYRHEKEKRLQIEKQLSEQKYNVYIRLLTIFFDILKQVKKGQKTNADKLIDKMIDIKKDLLIYGNDSVLKKFFEWGKYSQSKRMLITFADLVIEIRNYDLELRSITRGLDN